TPTCAGITQKAHDLKGRGLFVTPKTLFRSSFSNVRVRRCSEGPMFRSQQLFPDPKFTQTKEIRIMYCSVQIRGITMAVLGLATALNVAQALAGETQGQAAVMTSGNGVAVSGIWDADGFHGVYSGPNGGGRVVQSPKRKVPPLANPRVGAGVAIGPGAMLAIGDPDDDASGAVSVGTSAGAFAGVGAGGAIAIAGPGGVAVGVPGAPLMIVGSS